MRGFVAGALAVGLFACSAVAQSSQVDPIVIKGSKFFYKTNGTQFFIKGVAYQQDYSGGNGNQTASGNGTNTYVDPLADTAGCQRDIPYLLQLQTNTIRVYAIDPTKDHSGCMNALANAGIYVIADLSSPGASINRDSPAWNDDLYARYTSVVDAMATYSNTLGFFAGNEVSNAANNTNAIPFVKAAVRDTKSYIKSKNYRAIGVGYAADDDSSIRVPIANYMNCGDQSAAVDFWGYNIYSWCGQSSYQQSGYVDRVKQFSSYSVPVFFAEYGCNTIEPRPFDDVTALYGSDMSSVFSGGIVYEFYQGANNYGLISLSGGSVSTLTDFNNYKTKIASVSPSSVAMSAYNPTNSPQACPSADGTSWNAKATPLPPTPNKQLCGCMFQGLNCVVSSGTSANNYGQLFGEVCGLDNAACAGIQANGSTGMYGAYGMCNATEQLAFAFNQYYVAQSKTASACNFGGAATTQASQSAGSTCSALLSQAGTAGTGTVTSAPSGTGASSGGGGSASSSKGAASGNVVPSVESGLLPVAFIVTVAALSGMGMIVL